MSETSQSRKPDRQFYRHPRYDDPHCYGRDSKQSSGSTSEHALHANESCNQRPRGSSSFRHRSSRGFTRSNQNRKKPEADKKFSHDSSSDMIAASYPSNPKESKHEKTVTNNPPIKALPLEDVPQPLSNPSVDTPKSCNKHGGLILLPKDVDIHESIEEPKPIFQRFGRREPHAGAHKPVVVVRPCISHTKRSSETELTTHSNRVSGSKNPELPASLRAWQFDSSLPLWDNTTEAAFQFFLRNFNQFDQGASKTTTTSSNPHTVSGATVAQTAATPTAATRPPSEPVLLAVQQVVQLDSTLTSLLVPPGLCMSVLSKLRLESEQARLDLSEPERLLLRWWHSVQQLREHLFDLFESVILADLDFCNNAHVEQGMWKSVFYTVLELLRSWISNPESTGLLSNECHMVDGRSVDVKSKLATLLQQLCIHDVIEMGESRLQNLLERIQTIHRIPLMDLLAEGRPPPETRSRTRRLVYLSCQKLMLFLGDLARYKEILRGEQNFGKARGWYQKAQLLIPKNGRSYNQLAVLAVYTSRHLEAMYYYIRTLAASNPFPTASQSLAALFNDITPRAEGLIRQIQRPKMDGSHPHENRFNASSTRNQRVEIWIHPVDGQTTVIQGSRRLVFPSTQRPPPNGSKGVVKSVQLKSSTESNTAVDNDEDEDEDAQAELEEYANMSLIELSKQFALTFIHSHGKLFTKIGMETFPEVASLALQALSGLLAQNPCPLSAERLCQLCIVNMYNVDRAVSLTAHANQLTPTKSVIGADDTLLKLQPIGRLTGVETLRSVHHDHAARFALDMFSLLCRRAAQLFQQPPSPDAPSWWLPNDVRIILPALRLWSEWMILHPEHWLPPPNHRDPTLRPCLNDWQLVAELCTRASNWLAKATKRPQYEELTPTTSAILRLREGDEGDLAISMDAAFLFEESLCAGFKPMLDLVPKLYRYSGKWTAETVSDFVRIDKLVLFGDFLCGIDSPVLQYDVDRAVYESVIERESSERQQDRPTTNEPATLPPKGRSSSESDNNVQVAPLDDSTSPVAEPSGCAPSADILALQQQRAVLQRQLEEEQRLLAWRRNAIRQAALDGRRAVELEVRPIYLLPDTNCYIDWLEGIATLAQRSSNYTVLVPIVVVNELDTLARSVGKPNRTRDDDGGEVTRAGLIQERARAAIVYLENEFAQRNSRLRALTAKGSFLETIAYRTEVNGGRDPGQINDDVILTCCTHFCKEDPDRFRSSRGLDKDPSSECNNQPIRIIREIVLLTSDRNLRLKALNINLPARPIRTFVSWSRLPVVAQLPNHSNDSLLSGSGEQRDDFPKLKPRGQWKQPLKH